MWLKLGINISPGVATIKITPMVCQELKKVFSMALLKINIDNSHNIATIKQ